MTNHHSTRFSFLKAWTSIARSGTNEAFLANGPFPLYDRVVKEPRLDEIYTKKANLETFANTYQPRFLFGPSDNVRATFLLTRTNINQLKKLVYTKIPTLQYVSSFTVTCAYIWSCLAETRKDHVVQQLLGFVIDCRARLVPPVPSTYFGNCMGVCKAIEKTSILAEKLEGFVTAAKLLGECLNDKLNDIDGILKDAEKWFDLPYEDQMQTTITSISGTPKLKFYDMEFGWGKPRKYETISIDYNQAISLNASRESDEDLEIGVCLSATEMEAFVSIFNEGLQELFFRKSSS